MRTILLILLSIFSSSTPSYAADVQGLRRLFEQEFVSGYDDGKCQYNIRFLTAKAKSEGIDLSGAIYLTIHGYGDIWYYHGRTRAGQNPSTGMWYHHYVLAVPSDGSKNEKFSPGRKYMVLDFDFGNAPKLVNLRTYLRKMFMPPSVQADESRIGDTFELGLLKLTGHTVTDLIGRLDSGGEFPSGTESAAAQFKEVKFHSFYESLP